MSSRKKVIFFSHAVTMAHFTRPLKWIECLDTNKYDIYIATHPDFKKYLPSTGVTFINLSCIDAKKFAEIVGQAQPIYDKVTFENHVQEDLGILDRIQPDVVIGDFRHSLSVSCRLRKIKYINITNAYWSPHIAIKFPLPEASIVRTLGLGLAKLVISPFLKIALKINFFKMAFIVRKSLKTANLSFRDYRQVITDGDLTVYCDSPGLVPLKKQSQHELFVGPLVWSMSTTLPTWWSSINSDKKNIFLSLGSSGNAEMLPLILKALSKVDAEIVVALAGKKIESVNYPNIHMTDFLPMEEACREASLMICNGGSPMSHMALKHGIPTLGIVGNNDQLLNMAHLEKQGAGIVLRFWDLSEEKIITAVNELLDNPWHRQNAEKIKREFDSLDVEGKLRQIVADNI
jgi:UDP:flavonoid glycosyltransferase YjiC (YdhE family)